MFKIIEMLEDELKSRGHVVPTRANAPKLPDKFTDIFQNVSDSEDGDDSDTTIGYNDPKDRFRTKNFKKSKNKSKQKSAYEFKLTTEAQDMLNGVDLQCGALLGKKRAW